MHKIILFVVAFGSFGQICFAQDTISMNDAKVIKARSEITIGRYLNTLLNTISYTGAENTDIKDLIVQSLEGDDKKIFLNSQIAIADDISDPAYTNSSSSPDVTVVRYLNAFNTFYAKSDTNSVYFTDIRSSNVKKGKTNIYVNVYFTSYFKNKSLSNPDISYKPAKRVAEIFVNRTSNNKWLLYISRIGFLNPADTLNEVADDMVVTAPKKQADPVDQIDATTKPEEKPAGGGATENDVTTKAFNDKMAEGNRAFANQNYALARDAFMEAFILRPTDDAPRVMLAKLPIGQAATRTDSPNSFSQYVEQARLAEKKRNYQGAINLYSKAIDLDPTKRNVYEAHIKELNNSFRILAALEEKYQAGNFKSAIKGYSELLRKPKSNPDYSNSDYFLGRAKCYDKMGQLTKSYNEQVKNYNEALEDYRKSYEYDNENLETIRSRADIFRRMNRNLEALTEYKIYVAKDPTDITMYEAMSELHLLTGNVDQAIKDIEAALLQESIDPKLRSKLNVDKGILYARKQDFAGAEDYFTNAISLDSNSAPAYYNRGMSRIKMNRIQNAANDFMSARKKGLDSTSIKKIDSAADILFERGLAAYSNSKADSALMLFDAAIHLNPNKNYYYYARGEYYFSKNNFEEAIKSYSLAIGLLPNYHEAYYKRGLANLQLGKASDAIADFRRTSQYNPEYYLAQKGIGDAYFVLKDYKNSVSALEACLNMNSLRRANPPDTLAEIYNTIGKGYYNLNNLEKALENFLTAERKDSHFAEAHFNRGLILYKKNNTNEAIKEFRDAISLEKNHAQWHYWLARVLQDTRRYDEAISSFHTVISLDTTASFPDAIYQLGLCNYRIKNYQAALDSYTKYIASHPREIPTSFNYEMGNIYLNTGKFDSAFSYLSTSYQSDSTNGYVLYSMASCIYLRGNTEESLKWFERSFRTKALDRTFVDRDALLKPLQDDKRFKDLKKKYF